MYLSCNKDCNLYLHFLSLFSITESAMSVRRLFNFILFTSLCVRYGNNPNSITSVGKSMRFKTPSLPEIVTICTNDKWSILANLWEITRTVVQTRLEYLWPYYLTLCMLPFYFHFPTPDLLIGNDGVISWILLGGIIPTYRHL